MWNRKGIFKTGSAFQVSETENIRKNLAIERMIVEGCDILLDVNQMFVRQGTLVQILPAHHKSGARGRLNLGGNRLILMAWLNWINQCFFIPGIERQ